MKSSLLAKICAVAAAATMLPGCMSALKKLNEPKLDYREYAGEPVKSFDTRNYNGGWSAVSKDQLVFWTGINEAYLIKIAGYCPDLMFANAIAVTETAGRVDKFEKVIVGRDRCLIEEIRPIDTKQMKADRKLRNEQRKQSES